MAVARVVFFWLLGLFIVLVGAHTVMASNAQALEELWAGSLQTLSPKRADELRKSLTTQGAKISREGMTTKITFGGTDTHCVTIVNQLLRSPLEWTLWSGEKISENEFKGTVHVKGL